MFDKTFIQPTRTEYVPYEKTVTITEKKAPTDESIKLFYEMREKAKENLIKEFEVNDNIINAQVFSFNNNDFSMDKLMYIKFVLNGKTIIIKEKIPISECLTPKGYTDLIEKVFMKNLLIELAKMRLDYKTI